MKRALLLLLLSACASKKPCEACPDEASQQACEDNVSFCALLGPPGFPLRQQCVNSEAETCDALAEDAADEPAPTDTDL